MKVLILVLLCGLAMAHSSPKCCLRKIKLQERTDATLAATSSSGQDLALLLTKTITLTKTQLVHVSYVVSLYDASPVTLGFLVTKLFINPTSTPGPLTDNKFFRATTGNHQYHANRAAGFIKLAAGTHKIEVWYRADQALDYIANWS